MHQMLFSGWDYMQETHDYVTSYMCTAKTSFLQICACLFVCLWGNQVDRWNLNPGRGYPLFRTRVLPCAWWEQTLRLEEIGLKVWVYWKTVRRRMEGPHESNNGWGSANNRSPTRHLSSSNCKMMRHLSGHFHSKPQLDRNPNYALPSAFHYYRFLWSCACFPDLRWFNAVSFVGWHLTSVEMTLFNQRKKWRVI
jgi:hypothetical protein